MRKNIKKTTKRAILASGLVGVAAMGVVATGAAAYANTNQSSLADSIANKFNLNKAEVQKVIEQDHQRHAGEHLARLVRDGKLTQAQADMLKAKQAELAPKREAARNETDPAKRKAAMDAIRSEMDQWAKDNGIDLGAIQPKRGMHGPVGMGMDRMKHDGDADDTSQAR